MVPDNFLSMSVISDTMDMLIVPRNYSNLFTRLESKWLGRVSSLTTLVKLGGSEALRLGLRRWSKPLPPSRALMCINTNESKARTG